MQPNPDIETESYLTQEARWPASGHHILAHYDERSIIVYQAYRPEIGHYAALHCRFGGAFSYSRMSWIKPNFLWMMYRSGWGTKPGQEVILAVELSRAFFEAILESAVPSSFDSALYSSREEWQREVRSSQVRLQWDPDHDPTGGKVERRAVQLGLRGDMLERYGRQEAISIADVSSFVAAQRPNATARRYEDLQTPVETVYVPDSLEAQRRLRLDLRR